jgi:uncharacterized protein YndB with AHSA1/START domain
MMTPTQLTSIGAPFTTARVFDAHRDLLWKCNTDPVHMAKWSSPEGFTTEVQRMEFRPGGTYHYCQRGPGDAVMWGKLTYRAIQAPEKLVCIQSFSDAQGGITAHPLSDTWPREMLSTVTFEDMGGGRTNMTITWAPFNASAEEQATFDASHAAMEHGWKGALDKLGLYLGEAKGHDLR